MESLYHSASYILLNRSFLCSSDSALYHIRILVSFSITQFCCVVMLHVFSLFYFLLSHLLVCLFCCVWCDFSNSFLSLLFPCCTVLLCFGAVPYSPPYSRLNDSLHCSVVFGVTYSDPQFLSQSPYTMFCYVSMAVLPYSDSSILLIPLLPRSSVIRRCTIFRSLMFF